LFNKQAQNMKKNTTLVLELIERIGGSQHDVAEMLQINVRTLRRYCSETDPSAAPEKVVMALRYLAQ